MIPNTLKLLVVACTMIMIVPPAIADHGYGMGMMHDDDDGHMMMRGDGMGMRNGMGMMGGGGMMHGMGMGYGQEMMAIMHLDLDDKQRSKLRQLHRDMRKSHLAMMNQIMDESDKLDELYDADKRDAKAIGKVYGKIFDIRRQMIESHIDTTNKALEMLTPEQRKQVKSYRGGMMGGQMMHGGMMR